MANRPVFVSKQEYPYYNQIGVEFEFHTGFALVQKQKSIASLHRSFKEKYPKGQIIEISSKSPVLLGTRLSAFNIMYDLKGVEVSLESIFQGSKVFEHGGPFHDIYKMGPVEAKKDPRIRENGGIICFDLDGTLFQSEPKDFFYNWIYSKTIYSHKDLLEELQEYDAFTDIEFNPQKSLNCQARTVAIIRGLMMAGDLEIAMKTPGDYLQRVYRVEENPKPQPTQLNLFSM